MMVYRVPYGDEHIRFEVRWLETRYVRRIAIHVEPDGRVKVDAPRGTTNAEIRKAVAKRAGWIHRHVTAARARLFSVLPREYVSGESLLYLGRRYRLKVVRSTEGLPITRLRGSYVELETADRSRVAVRAALRQWYRGRAGLLLPSRLENVVDSLRWMRATPALRFRLMTRQWGSCSASGHLTLNPMLVKAPPECIDYVLLHELCHLKEHNHGRRFYALLDRHMPDWPRRKERLDSLADHILD